MTVDDFGTMLMRPNARLESYDANDLRKILEAGTDKARIDAMKFILTQVATRSGTANSEEYHSAQILMTLIRFVMPTKNKLLKKLFLLYFENVPKLDSEQKLRQEMILVCNALRNDLQHPNEYLRGVTLRFLYTLVEPELLEPLVPTVRACLEHRHAYVRRNAIFAVLGIYRNVDYLIPDAGELMENVLASETDVACQRNAFVSLTHIDPDRASRYFASIADRIGDFNAHFQIALIEFIRKNTHHDRHQVLFCLETFLASGSNVVRFESATTMMQLTTAPTAVKAVASCYIDMAIKETDNNAKLMVLDRLQTLQSSHQSLINELVLDVLRVLSSTDLEVRRRCIDIALASVSARNVDDMVTFLRRELGKLRLQTDYDQAQEYKKLLLSAVSSCSTRFVKVAPTALNCFIECLVDGDLVDDLTRYIKEGLERVQSLRPVILTSLLDILLNNSDRRTTKSIIWIVGEYSTDESSVDGSFKCIRKGLGAMPLLASEQRLEQEELDAEAAAAASDPDAAVSSSAYPNTTSNSRKILSDGTYATESALMSKSMSASNQPWSKRGNIPSIRALLLDGHFAIGAILASSLVKMVLRLESISSQTGTEKINSLKAESMLIMTSIIRLGMSKYPKSPIDQDSYDRIMFCLQALSSSPVDKILSAAFTQDCKVAFENIVKADDKKARSKLQALKEADGSCIEDQIEFRIIGTSAASNRHEVEHSTTAVCAEGLDDADVRKAIGATAATRQMVSQLSKVVQLTGFSDPIYAETYVTVSHSDIFLDILLVNQTDETLQNVSIDITASGDLKISEKPSTLNLAPQGFATVKAGVKVSSTNNGCIFGCISFGAMESESVVLNNIQIDVVDYIKPAEISETDFREIWILLEWENKINLSSDNFGDLQEFLQFLLKHAHLNCITQESSVDSSGYLAANMYAKSMFGEEVLANVCLEKMESGAIAGHVRLRSRTQGIAVSLGDKINAVFTQLARQ